MVARQQLQDYFIYRIYLVSHKINFEIFSMGSEMRYVVIGLDNDEVLN